MMRRLLYSLALAGVGLALPAAAAATQLPPRSAQATGTLTSAGAYSFTVQLPGKSVGVLSALTTAANRLTAADYPYVWGGGHGQAGIASVGIKGPGHNGKRRGFDCSGAVAAVLAAGGLWPAGQSVPTDAGVIRQLLGLKLIARGAGVGPEEVTLYDHPGIHIFMNINGRFFGTSDGGAGGGDAKGGPGWLDDGAPDVTTPAFKRYHFVGSALNAKTDAGNTLAFQYGPAAGLPVGAQIGSKVRVVYGTTAAGTMVAQAVTLLGAPKSTRTTVSGTVEAIVAGDSSFTVTTATGQQLTLPVAAGSTIAGELASGQIALGDTVSVVYTSTASGVITLVSVTVTAVPPPTGTTTPVTTTPTVTSPTPPPPSGGQGV
jgi:hypothetical protein